MALEQLKVREIVKRAVSKDVDIPEFQRDFVWDPEQVKLLGESLWRDYPVGSFLLWDASQYQEARIAQGAQASQWIVDGQQRTTALCLLLGQKPYWWASADDWNKELQRYDVMVNVLPEAGNDRLEFALPNPVRRQDPRWVSMRSILSVENVEDLTPLAQRLATQVHHDPNLALEHFAKVHARLQRVWQIREREIPIIKIAHEVEDVAVIFARLNQAGTRAREADVVLALAAARNPGWVRTDYLPYRNDLEDRGWDLDPGILIRTMTGIGHGRARLIEVPKVFWDPANLQPVWKQTRDAISDVVRRLAQFGILTGEILPSGNSLIPLFVLHHRWGDTRGYSFNRALRWFLLANRDGRYSGSAITSLNEDVRAVAEAAGFDVALENLAQRLRVSQTIPDQEFLGRYDRPGNRFLRLVLYLVIFARNGTDWVDKSRLGYDKTGSPVTTGYEPQWHHIFPRRVLRSAGVGDDDIHALANITVVNERTNISKLADMEPWRYIQEFGISADALRSHLIPESFASSSGKDQWSVGRYTDFVVDRAQLLAGEANVLLKGLGD
ncbi:MAG: DUF262 domain-containing protein [Bacillota bacterium]|nr:DUF262 domain-containing protein [Bacillota bacterium]